MKQLFLLRHGDAVAFAASDAQRSLSQRGHLEVASTFKQVATHLKGLNEVWVSPYMRAQQTWQLVNQEIGNTLESPELKVFTQPAIEPSGNVAEVLTLLEQAFNNPSMRKLLLVTHQPFVGELLECLCGVDAGRYFMGTANMAAINVSITDEGDAILAAGLCDLQWLKQPNI